MWDYHLTRFPAKKDQTHRSNNTALRGPETCEPKFFLGLEEQKLFTSGTYANFKTKLKALGLVKDRNCPSLSLLPPHFRTSVFEHNCSNKFRKQIRKQLKKILPYLLFNRHERSTMKFLWCKTLPVVEALFVAFLCMG